VEGERDIIDSAEGVELDTEVVGGEEGSHGAFRSSDSGLNTKSRRTQRTLRPWSNVRPDGSAHVFLDVGSKR
jgi:hypothetical protein